MQTSHATYNYSFDNWSTITSGGQFVAVHQPGAHRCHHLPQRPRELNSADLLLQSSQVHLRSATQTIRGVRELTAQLLERSNHILDSRFLSNVKILK